MYNMKKIEDNGTSVFIVLVTSQNGSMVPLFGLLFWGVNYGVAVVNFGEKSSNAQGGARLGVIRGAVVAQEARVCGVFPDDEVGAVVKACITVAAQAEFVLVTLHITLVLSQFDSWSVAGACHNTGSNCRGRSGIPVDSRSGGGHRSSGVSDAGSTFCVKVFHFLDACSPPPPPAHPTPPHPTPPRAQHTGSPRGGVIQRRGHPELGVIQDKSIRVTYLFVHNTLTRRIQSQTHLTLPL